MMEFLTRVQWSPYAVGVGIGILSWFTFFISQKPIACSTTFARLSGMIKMLFRGRKVELGPYYQKFKPVVDWQMMLVSGIVIGALLSALLSGDLHWQWVPLSWETAFGTDPLLRTVMALLGGIIIGFGSRWAGGCTSGHGISGTLQLAVSSWISAVCFFIGGIVTAHLIFGLIG
ncbi:YeeE/YedE family protein [candidate division KSB1 bacterium]|nr:YeeE/YedE family protein [candidate division KSB1 bacterium]